MGKPLIDWLKARAAGVFLHPTALPGASGIGNLGSGATRWIDFLADAGMDYWQVGPLGPTGYGDSPYQPFSAFAGNPYLIDLEALCELHLLEESELRDLGHLPGDHVDYGGLYSLFWPVLRLAFRRFQDGEFAYLPNYGLFSDFKDRHRNWLDPYALFMALKGHFNGKAWQQWPASCREYAKATESSIYPELSDSIEAHRFFQYLFFGQWMALRRYARKKKVQIIGDIPLFVSLDSAEVWADRRFFQMGRDGLPACQAGVPPDYFSPDGQLWGNPLYDWKSLREDDFRWWIERFKLNFSMFDVVRLDHFRGLQAYWRVPRGAAHARDGRWQRGPGFPLFRKLKDAFPCARVIAEDLGMITPSVRRLLRRTGLPGMAVLQFAFNGDEGNLYLPHNLRKNAVVYAGTHDNDTSHGWFAAAGESVRDQVRRYLRVDGSEISWDLIRAAYASVSRLAVISLPDLLSLDSSARFNTPGVAAGNWQWRCSEEDLEQLSGTTTKYLRDLARIYQRTRNVNQRG